MIDWNFFVPEDVLTLSIVEQFNAFQIYWNSTIQARVGETIDGGWKNGNLYNSKKDMSLVLSRENAVNIYQKWSMYETEKLARDWLPHHGNNDKEDDVEDPDRFVGLDIIQPIIWRLDSESARWQFILSFLEFLGIVSNSSAPGKSCFNTVITEDAENYFSMTRNGHLELPSLIVSLEKRNTVYAAPDTFFYHEFQTRPYRENYTQFVK